jgi:lysophospholipase L1-like esterase
VPSSGTRLFCALALLLAAAPGAAAAQGRCWIATWASSQQIPEPRNALPEEDLTDTTLRQVVRTTIGGERLRVRLSNLFGTAPLRITAAAVARSADPASARTVEGSTRRLTFAGRSEVVIPPGAEYVSDPVALAAPPMSHLAVTIYLPEAPSQQTSHPGSRATSYFLHGEQVVAADLPGAKTIDHWYQISRVEVETPPARAALVTLGDSITDGSGIKPNSDTRWPDFLARRLQADRRLQGIAVINAGKGGNRVLLDGLGPNMLARFDRDVLGQPGVRYFLILGGVNDLGVLTRDAPASEAQHKALVAELIAAYAQMVARARARGVKAIGATILPYGGSAYYHPDAANEADRAAVNAWIRAPGNFDAVVDFDAALRDPANPTRLKTEYDNGDGLHPSVAGYQAMAALVPLSLFERPKGTGCP